MLLGSLVLVIGLLAGLVVTQPRVRSSLGLPGATRTTTYTNPVFDADFPDPTVMRASDGLYYAYATQTIADGRTINIQVARSKDLVQWERLPDALPVKPAWASTTQKFWAPHVSEHGGTFYMYFSADPNTQTGLCLAVATAKAPGGPFTDSGKPLKCGAGFANIDPMPFDDPQTGKRLLYWGSGFQPIKVQELAPDRISFAAGSKPVALLYPRASNPYERLIEGVFVVLRSGYYYLFYSGDNCCGPDAHYAVMVARSQSATGPFETLAQATKASGAKGPFSSVILQRNDRWDAPGHNSIVTDAAGQDWLVYHAIDSNNRLLPNVIGGDRDVRRIMLMDRLIYRAGWPRIEGGRPSTTPQQGPTVR